LKYAISSSHAALIRFSFFEQLSVVDVDEPIARVSFLIIIICYVVFIAFNINLSSVLPLMALNNLHRADVPLSNYSLAFLKQ